MCCNGDSECNAPSQTGYIIKKRGQLSIDVLEDFLVTDSSSDETSVRTRFRVPSVCLFVFFVTFKVSLNSSTMSPPTTESNMGTCCCG